MDNESQENRCPVTKESNTVMFTLCIMGKINSVAVVC